MIDVTYLKMTNLLLNEKCSKNDARNLFNFMIKAEVYAMIINIKITSFDKLKDDLTVKDYIEYMVTNSIAYFIEKKDWLAQKASSDEEYKFIGRYFCEQFLKQNFPGIASLDLPLYYKLKKWPIEKIAIPFLEYNLAHGGQLKLYSSSVIEIPENDNEIYYMEGAVNKFKNALQTEYFCGVSNVTDKLLGLSKDDIILSMEQIESSLHRLNGKKDSIDYLLLGIEKIRKLAKKDMWLGQAPFCNPDPRDCEKEFGWGYSAVDSKEINEEDYNHYGSSCQTGSKVLCRYSGKPTKYYKYDT